MLGKYATKHLPRAIAAIIASQSAVGGAPAWSPAQWFAANEQGAWYDPSDFSTMFQDSAGTTPVTAVEQPVGLALDKRLGLVLGSELIAAAADRDFSSNTGFWSTGPGVTIGSGFATFASAATNSGIYRNSFVTVGRLYEVKFTIASISSGAVGVGFIAGSTVFAKSVPGSYTVRVFASTGDFGILNSGTTTATVTGISIKEVAGNHASQSTAAARPVLQQDGGGKYYLAFDGVDDYLASATSDFSTTDKATVVAGVRVNGTGNQGLAGLITSAADFDCIYMAGAAPGIRGSLTSTGGPAQMFATGVTADSANAVHTWLFDIAGALYSDEVKVRVNGAMPTQNVQNPVNAGTGSFGSGIISVGNFFNGRIYGLIIRCAATADPTAAETWMNGKTGAY